MLYYLIQNKVKPAPYDDNCKTVIVGVATIAIVTITATASMR